MEKIRSCIVAGGLALTLAWVLANTAAAAWEISPASEATRLPGRAAHRWETALIYTPEMLFPGQLNCPAGYNVALHVLNLATYAIYIHGDSQPATKIAPNHFATLELGRLAPGEHAYALESAQDGCGDEACEGAHPDLKFTVRAGMWPGEGATPHLACFFYNGEPYPRRLLVPAGFYGELGLANRDAQGRTLHLRAGPFAFELAPGKLYLEELPRPVGGTHRFELPRPKGHWSMAIQ